MKKPKNFEEAMSQLEALVHELEEGEIGLEDSLKRYKQGMELHAYCQKRLRHVELELMKVLGDEEDASTTPEQNDEQVGTTELPF